jgi:hypothetical protein
MPPANVETIVVRRFAPFSNARPPAPVAPAPAAVASIFPLSADINVKNVRITRAIISHFSWYYTLFISKKIIQFL